MDSISRTAGRVLLGLSLPFMALSGCQTMKQARDSGQPPTAAAQAGQANTQPENARMAKTDFEAKVTKSQAFNTHIAMGKNAAQQGDYQLATTEFQKALDVSEQAKWPRVDAKGRADAHRHRAKRSIARGDSPRRKNTTRRPRSWLPTIPRS